MEYLRPSGVFTGRVILQLHGGGYIGPMKNTYRDFAMQYSRRSLGGDVLTVDYRVAPSFLFRRLWEMRWLLMAGFWRNAIMLQRKSLWQAILQGAVWLWPLFCTFGITDFPCQVEWF